MRAPIVFVLFIILPFLSAAQNFPRSEADSLIARQRLSELEIDGDLDEDDWQKADIIANFTQNDPDEGKPCSEKTRVAVLFDESNLYIGIWAFDSQPERINAREFKQDFDWSLDDHLKIILDPMADKRNGYLFVINPNGARADVQVTEGGAGFNHDWNYVWKAAVERDEEGWFIEIQIPLAGLKFPAGNQKAWGFNLERYIRRNNETSRWQGWNRNFSFQQLTQAGKLTGLSLNEQGYRFEFKPSLSAGFEKSAGQTIQSKAKLSADLNYRLSSTHRLHLTANTDFSQAESDRQEINLSRFSIFFPEKREFFLDGKDLFQFSLGQDASLFYSRQIGISGEREVPIPFGGRVTGKSGGTSLGVLSMQTAKTDSLPSANYSVVRLKQDVLDESNIGLILTSHRDSRHYNYLYGLEANYATSEFLGESNLEMGASLAQSFASDEPGRQNTGYKAYLDLPNDFINFEIFTARIGKDFNPGIGYLRRQNYQLYYSALEFKPRPRFLPAVNFLEIVPFEMEYYLNDQTGRLETANMEFRPVGIELRSGDRAEFNIQHFFDHPAEAFELIDDLSVSPGRYWFTRYETGLESSAGRPVFGEIQYTFGRFYEGSRQSLEAALGFHPSGKFNLSADWEHNRLNFDGQTVSTDELGARLEYNLNTSLFTSIFGQWNNEDKEVLLNYRLNWMFLPGSYFYLVLNQIWETGEKSPVLAETTVLGKLIWRFQVDR